MARTFTLNLLASPGKYILGSKYANNVDIKYIEL